MTDNHPTIGADDPIVVTMFDQLGIPRLAEIVASGDLSELSDVDVEGYARIAASWSGPPLADDDSDWLAEGAHHFASQTLQVLFGQGPDYVEIGGEPYLRDGNGTPRPVSEHQLAHFQRMWSLLSDPDTARAFLELCPSWAAAEGADAADKVWDASFRQIIARLD